MSLISTIGSLFSSKSANTPDIIQMDKIAELINTSPEALKKFEESYKSMALDVQDNDLFSVNSRQASSEKQAIQPDKTDEIIPSEEVEKKLQELCSRIVDELLSETQVYTYDGKHSSYQSAGYLPKDYKYITSEDLSTIPYPLRPELSGNLMKIDLQGPSFPLVLQSYKQFLEETNSQKKRQLYGHFRQGLDIVDLDEIVYKIIEQNKNSMGFWLPMLVNAVNNTDGTLFKIPKTKVASVPLPLLQLTRLDYNSLHESTIDIVDSWAYKAFNLDESKDYFIKTGTYSSKFDFRNAKVSTPQEVRELGEYLLYIHFQALQMAGHLCSRPTFGVSTTTDWVVREYIHDSEDNPCIYKGLPLHTEYRVFIDCDSKQVLGYTPYWDPETMLHRFSQGADSNSPHNKHDYVIYKSHEPKLMERYSNNIGKVISAVEELIPNLDLPGQWSLDIMQNGSDFWLIDMALAEASAFYDHVPKNLRKPMKEDWIPKLENFNH